MIKTTTKSQAFASQKTHRSAKIQLVWSGESKRESVIFAKPFTSEGRVHIASKEIDNSLLLSETNNQSYNNTNIQQRLHVSVLGKKGKSHYFTVRKNSPVDISKTATNGTRHYRSAWPDETEIEDGPSASTGPIDIEI